jgi:hypothetical protein
MTGLPDRIVAGDVLDSLAAHIAVVSHEGVILAVNRRWSDFALENGCGDPDSAGVGRSYFEVRFPATGDSGERSGRALRGLARILAGESDLFEMEYRCDSPTEKRWFLMQVTPLAALKPRGAVVAHHHVTTLHKEASEAWAAQAAGTVHTAQSYGIAPLAEAVPVTFDEMVRTYDDLIERAFQERLFGPGEPRAEAVRALAAAIGRLGGGPRDAMDLRFQALRKRTLGASAEKTAIYQEESRLLLLELMGHLVSHYRSTRQIPFGS